MEAIVNKINKIENTLIELNKIINSNECFKNHWNSKTVQRRIKFLGKKYQKEAEMKFQSKDALLSGVADDLDVEVKLPNIGMQSGWVVYKTYHELIGHNVNEVSYYLTEVAHYSNHTEKDIVKYLKKCLKWVKSYIDNIIFSVCNLEIIINKLKNNLENMQQNS